MKRKLAIQKLFKIFGPRPDEALELARQGVAKDEVFRRTASVVAVNDVSLDIAEGEIFVVMGLSGSGKSTLIRCINRLFEPTSGTVLLGDVDVTKADKKELRQIRLRRTAMVFQHFALLPHKTVVENAAFGLKVRGLSRAERRREALRALETVGLDAWADSYPDNLSGGMQQRVGLARSLAVQPELLLMDEPFSALDPLIRRDMQDELLAIQARLRSTIVFITHDLQEALRIGDHVAIMKDGLIVQVGTPEEIVISPAEDYVADFTEDVDRSRVLSLASVMQKPKTARPDTPAREIAGEGGAADGRGTFVVDNQRRPIGFIAAGALGSAKKDASAADLMAREFAQADRDTRIFEAFGRLQQPGPLAVVDGKGRLVGEVDPASVFHHLDLQPRARSGRKNPTSTEEAA